MNDGKRAPRLTRTQWLICTIAAIGFAFDIYELLMLPLIIKPAIAALSVPLVEELVRSGMARPDAAALYVPGGARYVEWARLLFFLPAFAGGVLGLCGGYLTDRLGRRRVLTFSILLYAFSAFAAGFATSLTELLIFRCLVFAGVCIEFVAAVAWLAELFPERERRERVLGYTQAFSSLGGLMVAAAVAAVSQIAATLPEIRGGHEAWRYALISGVIPALPLLVIRPFLPESPEWQRKRDAGELQRPSMLALLGRQQRRATIVTTLLFASVYGIAFGAIQQVPQILGAPGRGHVEVVAAAQQARSSAVAEAAAASRPAPQERELRELGANAVDHAVSRVSFWQEIGGLLGRLLLALLVVRWLSKRGVLRVFQLPALLVVPLFLWWLSANLSTAGTLGAVKAGIFVAGLFTIAQMSFLGNYIPLVFPLHLRGTGQSIAANIGGRILGTTAAWLTITLSRASPPDPSRIATVGALVAGGYALLGVIATFWLPEPRESPAATAPAEPQPRARSAAEPG